MNIKIIRNSTDLLNQKIYYFYIYINYQSKIKVQLDRYYEEIRSTKKHKYKVIKQYNRLDERNNKPPDIKVNVPPDVLIETKVKVIDSIEFI